MSDKNICNLRENFDIDANKLINCMEYLKENMKKIEKL